MAMIRPWTPHATAPASQKVRCSDLWGVVDSFGYQSRSDSVVTGRPAWKICIRDVARAFLEHSHDDALPAASVRQLSAKSSGTQLRRQSPKWSWKSETGRRRKKRYPERVTTILKSLEECPDSEIEKGLEQWKGQLQVREQSIILNEERSLGRVLRIFSWLQRQDDYSPNVFHYNIMLKVAGRAHKLGLVEKLWKEMEEKKVAPTNVSYCTVIDACGKVGDSEKALDWLVDMRRRGFDPDEVTMNSLVNLHKQTGNVDAAEKAFSSVSRNVENCNTMIDLYGSVGRYADATRIFSDMAEDGIRADTVTFNTMIKVCGLAGRVEEAEALFARMQQAELSPNVVTFNILVTLFAKVGMIEKSLDYFSRMKQKRIMPDVVTFQTLLSALTQRGMVSEAEATAKEMSQLGFRTGEEVSVALARMYIHVGLSDKAAGVLKSYRPARLSSSNLAAVIDSYAEARLWREAEELFFEYKQSWSVENFNTVVKAYGLAHQHEKAWELYATMEEKGVSPDEITYNSMIHALSTASQVDLEKVERVRSEMQRMGYDLRRSSFNVLITVYGKLRKAREAQRTFEQMKSAGVAPDGISYGALIYAFAEAGLVKDAERAAIAMRKAGFSPNRIVYTTLMKLYGKMDDIEKVEKVYADMGRTRLEPDLFAANLFIDQYAKAGNVKDAERVFRGLAEDVGRLGVNEITLTIMLKMYKKSGLVHEALGMAKKMLSMDGLNDIVSYNSILGLYASLGRVSQVTEVFRCLSSKNVEPDMITYSIMAGVMKKTGSFQEALDLFATAASSGLSPTAQSLTSLINLYARAGMVNEASQTWEKLLHGGFTLDNPAVNSMIYAYGRAGRFDEGLRLFMDMQTHGLQPDVVTYTTVIEIYGQAGLLEGVSRIFKRMKQAGCAPSMATYRVLIDIYRRAGKLDLAAMVQQEMQFAEFAREKCITAD